MTRTDRITAFLEKPADPPAIPGDPDHALASMGIYVFKWSFLRELLIEDMEDGNSSHDFGNDIIPRVVEGGKAQAHRFEDSCVQSGLEIAPYWRDVGTIDAFWQANIDLTKFTPPLDLYDTQLADLDLFRKCATGQIHPQRGQAPRHGGVIDGIGRVHHFRV